MKTKRRFRLLVLGVTIVIALVGLQKGHAKRGAGPNSFSAPSIPAGVNTSGLLTGQRAFTFAASQTIIPDVGNPQIRSTVQRFQRSDGVYKLVQTFYSTDGATERVQTHFGFMGLGVFRLDLLRKLLIFTGPQIDAVPTDVETYLRSQSLYTRDESVLGLSTIVWRKPGRTKADFVEEYRAPSLGGLLVKSLKVSARGREVFEPTTIQLGEPPSTLFSELVLYPSNYSSYERRVLEMERNGEPEVAGMMRRLLERMRHARP